MKTNKLFLAILTIVMAFSACDVLEEPYIEGADDEKAILEFSVDSIVGVIDESAKTVTLSVPEGTDVSSLTPTIIVSTYAAVEPASGEAQDFTNPVQYTVTAFNGTEARYLVSAVIDNPDDAKCILAFRIENPATDGVIMENMKKVVLTFPTGTDVTSLVPIIEVSEGASIEPASGEAQDFSSPVEYTVTAINGTTAVYTVEAIVEDLPDLPQGKTVLLKEFTGVRCVNCPAAAELAHQMQEQYGENLIVMGIHAGSFAMPGGSFIDFRTAEGDDWYNNYGSNPIATIDKPKLLTGCEVATGLWQTTVESLLEQEQTVEIRIRNTYDEASRQLTTVIDAEQLMELSGDFALTVCLVEDNIVGAQLTPGGVNTEYIHRHVFRGTLNGSNGEVVSFDEGGKLSKTYSYSVPEEFIASNCSIVAYIYDNNQNMQILQTAEKHF